LTTFEKLSNLIQQVVKSFEQKLEQLGG